MGDFNYEEYIEANPKLKEVFVGDKVIIKTNEQMVVYKEFIRKLKQVIVSSR
uniref:Uncharacterized protein n=1 Tax=Pyramimonas orientalis virus TaxID=455367 RepID=A0A7L9AYZ4_POV01|nr:hypothetical protein HWQ62_00375 [Pyramimonas orientalis virus]